jgi:hypothetical protein
LLEIGSWLVCWLAMQATVCREFPSYVKHFIDDNGNFLDTIDLHAHHEETGVPITNAVVQEVTDLIPGITSLNINDCNLVTDVGLWCGLSIYCTHAIQSAAGRFPGRCHGGLQQPCRNFECGACRS